jgi:nucleotide-binding universal stress UspA family protein
MQRILVGTDTTAAADLVVDAAVDLAMTHDAELLVLHVRDGTGVRDAVDPSKRPDPDGYLAEMSGRFPSLKVRSWSERGNPGERLCTEAVEERADAIVVGNLGAHGSRWRARESVPSSSSGALRARCSSSTRGRRSDDDRTRDGSAGQSRSRRNASTAITRRCTSGSCERSSL